MFRTVCVSMGFVVGILTTGRAMADPAPAERLATAATAFLQSLDGDLRSKVQFEFDADQRFVWHFVPMDREGVPLRDMSEAQQASALAMVKAGLSEEGFETEEAIRSLDIILREIENNPSRDPDKYYVMIFGDPAPDGTWALRFEGHHLSLHWTVVKGHVSLNLPQFLGSNPADVHEGPQQGLRVLGAQEDLGRALVTSLSEGQRAKAVISKEAPKDVLSGNQREMQIVEHVGLPYGELTEEQKSAMLALIEAHARVQVKEVAENRLKRLKDSLDTVTFVWMGGFEKGQAHYYRVQSDKFIIEYDNIQNNANHIHTIWRDVDGDFGEDLLKLHYQQHAHNPGHGHDGAGDDLPHPHE
ncbi:MAG: hypothetical protein AMXMBFR84_34380 [Candidatus Hydrogenedentota bacterium]